MAPACSQALDSDESQPYFVWDEPITVAGLRARLAAGDPEERVRWAARVMRDARFDDVWRFLEVDDVLRMWSVLAPKLGRRRTFWTWILDRWRADGLIA